MADLNQYFRFAQFAEAAYANLVRAVRDRTGLINSLRAEGSMPIAQRELFSDQYEVLHYLPNDRNGFSATVFRRLNDGEITIGFRGTEGIADVTDISEDIQALVGSTGYARAQILSMANYVNRLFTPADRIVGQYIDAPEGIRFDRFVDGLATAGNGLLPLTNPTTLVNVTGHSLGGHLAMAFSQIFSSRLNHAYTYNAFGFVPNPTFSSFLAALGGQANFSDHRVTNIAAQGGWSFAAGGNNVVGGESSKRSIVFEAQSSLTSPIHNHSIVNLTDAIALHSMFALIQPSISQNLLNTIVKTSSNETGATLESALDALRRLFRTETSAETSGSGLES